MTRHQVLATVAALLLATRASAQTILTLDEAIARGLTHNRTVANAALEVDKADQNAATAHTWMFPTLKIEAQGAQLLRPVDVTFSSGVFGDFPGIGPVPSKDTRITTPARFDLLLHAEAQQPLTKLIKLNLNAHISQAVRDEDREQLREARLALVDQVRRLYYSIGQTRSALEANTHTLAMLRELDRLVARRVSQQVALKVDGLAVQSRIAQAELARLTLTHSLESQKEQLNLAIGRDIRTPFDVEELPAARVEETDLDAAEARALEARPDVARTRIKLREAELAHRAARADRIPDVALAASFLSPINVDGAPRQIATAAIQAQWEPWDWGRKRRAVAARALEIQQARNSVSEQEDRARLEVANRYRRLEEARATLQVARTSQAEAREGVRLRLAQYEIDAALTVDVLQAQTSLGDADHRLQEALAAFWTARAEFEHALGEETTR